METSGQVQLKVLAVASVPSMFSAMVAKGTMARLEPVMTASGGRG